MNEANKVYAKKRELHGCRRGRPLKLSSEDKRLLFWYVAGIGRMGRKEFEEWLRLIDARVGDTVVLPPYWGSDLPFGDLPDLPLEAERLALAFMAEALFKTLHANGQLRGLDAKIGEMEKLVATTRELLRSERMGDGGSEQISV